VTGFFPTLFLAVEVAVAVAALLDFAGEEEDDAALFLFGAIASTSDKNKAPAEQRQKKHDKQQQTKHKKQRRYTRRSYRETTKEGWIWWKARRNHGGLKKLVPRCQKSFSAR
jgi:hypothetical protein